MRPEDLLLIDGDYNVLEGDGEVERSAFYIHRAGHRANPRHKCILHTHMPYATCLTMVEGGKLEMAHQTAIKFWGRVDYEPEYGGLAHDDSAGSQVAGKQAENPMRMLFFWPPTVSWSAARPSPWRSMICIIWSAPASSRSWPNPPACR